MTKKGVIRLSWSLIIGITAVSSLTLGVAIGLPNVTQRKNHLRTVNNSSNRNLGWYSFDNSAKSGNILPNDFVFSSINQGLVRKMAIGENVKVINQTKPINDDFSLNLQQSPDTFHEFYRFELANEIIIHQRTNPFLFNSDAYNPISENIPNNSINSLEFKQKLNDKETTAIQFKIRNQVPWVDHKGQIVKDSQGLHYYVEAKDWLYGLYRMGITNNNWRNSPLSDTNPFGGFGVLPNGKNQMQWSENWKNLSQKLQAFSSGISLSAPGDGFNNSYLYDLLNIQNPAELVQVNQNGVPNLLSKDNSSIIIGRQNPNQSAGFGRFFEKMILNTDFAAVPNRYIAEVSSKIDHVNDIKLPNINDENIVSDEINIRKYGQFTYGTTFDKTLYTSAYYVSQSNSSRNRLELNKHYWDQEFVKKNNQILSYTEDYVEISDQQVFFQSIFDQYNNDRIYELKPSSQTTDKLQMIRQNPTHFGLKYQTEINLVFPNILIGSMLPFNNHDYLYNDGFARMWFGTSIDQIKNGNMKFSNFIDPYVIAARSQMFAAINWYSQLRTLDQNNSLNNWHSYFPPSSKMFENYDKNFSDFYEELNQINYWTVENKNLVKNTISLKDNINHYNKSSTQSESLKSPHFNNLKLSFQKTLDVLLKNNPNQTVEFDLSNRFLNPDPNTIKFFQQTVKTIKELDPRLNPKLKITSLSPEITNHHFRSKSLFEAIGWGPDYDGGGTWLTGLNRSTTSIATLALAIANDPSLVSYFPHLTQYGQFLNKEIKTDIKKYFDSKDNSSQVIKNLFTAKSPLEAVNDLKNSGRADLSYNKILKTLFVKEGVNLTSDQEMELEIALQYFQKSISNVDLKFQEHLFNDHQLDGFIKLSQEYTSIVGIGIQERQFVANQQKPQEKIWKPWLIFPRLRSGVIQLADLRIRN